MGIISVSLPSDGQNATVSQYNTPITTIVNAINGNLDNNNLSASAAIAGSKVADSSIDLAAKASADSGWRNVTDTWTYLSATQVTVPSNAALKYDIGDRVRFNQSGSKFFYITDITTTVLTLNAGTDYSVANAAISGIVYSKVPKPLGFPGGFNYLPTFTGFSVSPTSGGTRFTLIGRTCFINYSCFGGTSNSANTTATLPITASTAGGGSYIRDGWIRAQDNSVLTSTPGVYEFDTGATSLNVYKDQSGGSWTSSGTKGFRCNIVYEV